jgi:hypothetical protein
MAELQVATVRGQMTLSLFTNVENVSSFTRPVNTMLDRGRGGPFAYTVCLCRSRAFNVTVGMVGAGSGSAA